MCGGRLIRTKQEHGFHDAYNREKRSQALSLNLVLVQQAAVAVAAVFQKQKMLVSGEAVPIQQYSM